MTEIKKEDNGSKGKFMVFVEGKEAGMMSFTWAGSDKFIIDSTMVDPAFSGQGLGYQLFNEAVSYARKEGVKIIPLCPFAKKAFEKDSTNNDVLA